MNTFGNIFRLTSFGESHGPMIGGVIDGCPSGLYIDRPRVQEVLNLRRPGQSRLTTTRSESDRVEFISGIKGDYTTGAPIAFLIPNRDANSQDYAEIAEVYRPGHADYTYHYKYGGYADIAGGGRSSARETAVRCVGGAVASMLLDRVGVEITAFVSQVGEICLDAAQFGALQEMPLSEIRRLTYQVPSRCPFVSVGTAIEVAIERVREAKDSLGGVVSCIARGVPLGWGEPMYGKLESMLASAMMSIQASRGFEIGDGFALVAMLGSESNDCFHLDALGEPALTSNHGGGVLGGISSGGALCCRVAFKPTPTIACRQQTVGRDGRETMFQAKGRHDPCVAMRAVPVVEAMAAMVLADAYLMSKASSHL